LEEKYENFWETQNQHTATATAKLDIFSYLHAFEN
jgi:hypothetical protein